MKKIFSTMALLMTLLITGCTPDEYNLGDKALTEADLVEGVAYTVTHDADNPNIVYLKSLLPSRYTVLWDEPAGRSQEPEVTLKLPFAGTYSVRMGVETRGGVVYGPYTTFVIDQFCSDFVTGEMWEWLTGGVGSKKRWYLDIDATGTSRYYAGPLYFYGTDVRWENVQLGQPGEGDNWGWAADWAGNSSWLMSPTGAMDYGYMEFSLEGGATVTVVDNATGSTYNGTFTLDTDNHTLRLTDAPMLHEPGRDAIVSQWGQIYILAMGEDHIQMAVLRDSDPNEGPALLSYNFISEEYRDNWTPSTEKAVVTPSLAADWRDYIEPKTMLHPVYKLSPESPFGYSNCDGSAKSGLSLPAASISAEDLTLEFGTKDGTFVLTTPDGTAYEGTYSLSDDGVYTFSTALPAVQLSQDGEVVFRANADNTLRVVRYETDDYTGGLTNLYLGRACLNNLGEVYQYETYNFVLQNNASDEVRYTASLNANNSSTWAGPWSAEVFVTGEGSYTFTITGDYNIDLLYLQVDKLLKDHPQADIVVREIKLNGSDIPFDDNANIIRCVDDGSDEGAKFNARRYFLNPWNVAATLDPTPFSATQTLSVTVDITFDCGEEKFNN